MKGVKETKEVREAKETKAVARREEAPEPNRDPSSEAIYSPARPARVTESKNEFMVTDVEAHTPSVHSDNSTGSTTSFTVSELTSKPPVSGDSSLTSRQKWTVSPTLQAANHQEVSTSSTVVKTISSKRERREEDKEEED